MNPNLAIGLPPSPTHTEQGHVTSEYFTYCVGVLRFVAEFAQKAEEGEEQDFFCGIEDTLETRQAFAMAPKALKVVTNEFKYALSVDYEHSRDRLHANLKPLAPQFAKLKEREEARAARIAEREAEAAKEEVAV